MKIIPGGQIYVTNTANNLNTRYPVMSGSVGWTNVGYATGGIGGAGGYAKPKRVMPPHRYLIAIETTSNIKYKVRWLRNTNGSQIVLAGKAYIGDVKKESDGWTASDNFGILIEGFASRRAASIHLLKGHFQFTPALELANDQHK